MLIVPRVLIALDQDRIVPRDEEPGHGMARQVIVDGEALALKTASNSRRRLEPAAGLEPATC